MWEGSKSLCVLCTQRKQESRKVRPPNYSRSDAGVSSHFLTSKCLFCVNAGCRVRGAGGGLTCKTSGTFSAPSKNRNLWNRARVSSHRLGCRLLCQLNLGGFTVNVCWAPVSRRPPSRPHEDWGLGRELAFTVCFPCMGCPARPLICLSHVICHFHNHPTG